MPVTFYPKVGSKYQGIICTIFFLLAVGVSISLFFLDNPAAHGFKNENSVAIVGGMSIIVFGTMLVLSIFSWVSYYYTRLSFDVNGISSQTLTRINELAWTDLKSVEWLKIGHQGGIKIHSLTESFSIGLQEFSPQDRLEIIRLLRVQVPEDAQKEWPHFCHRFAIPLVKSLEQMEGAFQKMAFEDNKEYVKITRQRYDRLAVILLPMSVAISLLLVNSLELKTLYALPLMVVVGWLLLRFNTPKEGIREYRVTATPRGKAFLVVFGMIFLSYAVMFVAAMMNVDRTIGFGISISIMLLAFPPLFYFSNQAEKQKDKGLEESLTQWDRFSVHTNTGQEIDE